MVKQVSLIAGKIIQGSTYRSSDAVFCDPGQGRPAPIAPGLDLQPAGSTPAPLLAGGAAYRKCRWPAAGRGVGARTRWRYRPAASRRTLSRPGRSSRFLCAAASAHILPFLSRGDASRRFYGIITLLRDWCSGCCINVGGSGRRRKGVYAHVADALGTDA